MVGKLRSSCLLIQMSLPARIYMHIVKMMTALEFINIKAQISRSGKVDLPDWCIEQSNTKFVPLSGNPTPKRGIAVHAAIFFSADYKVNSSRNQRNAIAEEEVPLFQSAKLVGTEVAVEGEIDIACHCERPVCISWHEPEDKCQYELK